MRPEPSRPRKKGAKDKGEHEGEFDDEGLAAPPDFTPRFMPMIRKITRFLSPKRLKAVQKCRKGWYALLKRYSVETKFISAPPPAPTAELKPSAPQPPPPKPKGGGGGKKHLKQTFNRPSGPRR